MNCRIGFILLIAVVIGVQPVFAFDLPEPEFGEQLFIPIAVLAAGTPGSEEDIPQGIRNNRYYLESLRLAKLAEETYDYGDYDTSAGFAQEAIRFAQLSDEFVVLQLKINESDNAISVAKQRLDWAVSIGASRQYPREYSESESYYNASLSARSAEQWDEAIAAANRVIELLAYITPAPPPATPRDGVTPLPAQYTVRPWSTFKDCLWNISAYPWVYGDPYQWRLLYNANKSRMPNPDNPDLIEPGMVLDIPSLKGETRQGVWDSSKAYTPLN